MTPFLETSQSRGFIVKRSRVALKRSRVCDKLDKLDKLDIRHKRHLTIS